MSHAVMTGREGVWEETRSDREGDLLEGVRNIIGENEGRGRNRLR